MQAAFTSKSLHPLLQLSRRSFTYDVRELQRMNNVLRRKINIMKMFTEHRDFNYEQPKVTYDSPTGEVKMHESENKKTKKIIKNMDDRLKSKRDLYSELGLDQDGNPREDAEEVDVHSLAEKMKE